MVKEKESSSDCGGYGGGESSSQAKNSNTEPISREIKENPDEDIGFPEKGIDFLGDSEGSQSKLSRYGNSGSQELTLSYLCDNSKLGFSENGKNLLNSFEKLTYKGKEVVSENHNNNQDEFRWVERDFLQMNEMKGNSSKREVEDDDFNRESPDKKPKLETLNLSLALPDVSLSLNPIQSGEPSARQRLSRSESFAPSTNTMTTYSNDFSGNSFSYSHQFSHNPSCSLSHTENYEYSMGSHRRDSDQIWNAGEGTNGSVHSRFRPVGDGVAFSNIGSGILSMMQGNRPATSSDNVSFFPSELPARPGMGTQSGDSRGRGSESMRGLEGLDGGRARKLSRPERILREIVSESIPTMAQIVQDFTDETVESTKEYLKNLITMPEKREELVGLQKRLERRSDLTKETLLKSNKNQLEVLVAIKMGLVSFLSSTNRLPTGDLVEIFLFEKCKNVNCKRLLPVEDCDCKICSTKKGFCSECMCPVCLNFDCANNTCSWVGCDVCSHWSHAACGIEKNLIRPGPSLKGPQGTTEMQFHCLCCGHASEMFGFVKDVFLSCAKEWPPETLMKELDCVRKIFRGSEDFKGKELHVKAGELLSKLDNKVMSPSDVCGFILNFFNYTNLASDFPVSNSGPSKNTTTIQATLRKDAAAAASLPSLKASLPSLKPLPPKTSFYNMGSSSGRRDTLQPHDHHQNDLKPPLMNEKIIEDEWSVKSTKKDGFDSLESLVRVKEAEARMFQNRADEARREAEGYRRMVRMKSDKLEEEYTEKLSKLCLQETEERRRKKLDELKNSENAHCDYYKMKLRMQAEIAGLLERMETTKKQWV